MSTGVKNDQRATDAYEAVRLQPHSGRGDVWRAIAEHASRWFPSPCETVIDLGCGYGDFIAHVAAARRTGVDTRDCAAHLPEGIEFVQATAAAALESLPDASVDLVFASNLLEHLDWDDIGPLLGQVERVLRRGGRLMLLQPNFAHSPRAYFDDYTHRTIFTHESLAGWVRASGLEPVVVRPRYLPLTMKSRLPRSYRLTKLYLALGSPLIGGQMLVVAERP